MDLELMIRASSLYMQTDDIEGFLNLIVFLKFNRIALIVGKAPTSKKLFVGTYRQLRRYSSAQNEYNVICIYSKFAQYM